MVFSSLSATVVQQGLIAAVDTGGSTFLWIALIAGLLGLLFAAGHSREVIGWNGHRKLDRYRIVRQRRGDAAGNHSGSGYESR